MTLYYALAFFGFILGKLFRNSHGFSVINFLFKIIIALNLLKFSLELYQKYFLCWPFSFDNFLFNLVTMDGE